MRFNWPQTLMAIGIAYRLPPRASERQGPRDALRSFRSGVRIPPGPLLGDRMVEPFSSSGPAEASASWRWPCGGGRRCAADGRRRASGKVTESHYPFLKVEEVPRFGG